MSMTFYYGSGSPFAWRVWLALEYKQIPYDFKLLSFSAGETRTPRFVALNPRHTVPTIVDEDFVLYESAAILEYLDERFADTPSLFPGSVRERAIIRRIVREADEHLSDARDKLSHQVFHVKQEEWQATSIAEACDAFATELAAFENYASGDIFLLGDEPTAADFTLYPYIALALRAELRCAHAQVRSRIGPKLSAWMQRVESLPYFDKTIPPHWKTK